jgi:hypothetical protein
MTPQEKNDLLIQLAADSKYTAATVRELKQSVSLLPSKDTVALQIHDAIGDHVKEDHGNTSAPVMGAMTKVILALVGVITVLTGLFAALA